MKQSVSILLAIAVLLGSVACFAALFPVNAAAAEKERITLYASSDEAQAPVPAGYRTSYTIPVPEDGGDYRVASLGECVEIADGRTVRPKSKEVTVWGMMDGSVSTVTEYTFGETPVVVYSNDKRYCKTYWFDVVDYTDVLVDEFIDDYIEKHIPASLSVREKLEKVGEYIASFDYNVKQQSLKGMLLSKEGGDCWASTDAVLQFCEHLGIPARACSDEAVSLMSGGHMYALAFADGKYYIVEAGYSGKAPRPYVVSEVASAFDYTPLSDTTCAVTQYLGAQSEIVVPREIDGYTVTALGSQCFYLANLYIKGGIRSVILPDTLETIGASCFYDCSRLGSLRLPASVSRIEMGAFNGCTSLQLTVDETNPWFIEEDGILYSKDKKSIVSGYNPASEDLAVPYGVEKICDSAFASGKFRSVTFPDTLKDIGFRAFTYSDFSGAPIVLPKSVEGIGYGSFFVFGNSDITILNPDMVINNTKENDLCDQEDGNTIRAETIRGARGSTAEAYAETYGRDFKEPCAAVLNNGAHDFGPHTCAEETVRCTVCGYRTENPQQHAYVTESLDYYSNTKDPFLWLHCSVCGESGSTPLYYDRLLPGDTNIDGKITALDARYTLRSAVGLEYNDALKFYQMDVNGDHSVTAADARLILRAAVGLEDPALWRP